MSHSIRLKMTAILILIVGGIIALICLINSTFATNYYVFREKKALVDTYNTVKNYLEEYEQDKDSSALTEKMEYLSEKTNIKIMVTQPSAFMMEQITLYDNLIDHTRKYYELMDALMRIRSYEMFVGEEDDVGGPPDAYDWIQSVPGTSQQDIEELKKNDYLIKILADAQTSQKGIYLLGYAGENYTVGMRVAMEGIRENAAISSQFILYIGIIGMLVGCIVMFIYSATFTKPIKDMAGIANRMANLDFDAKVPVSSSDELGELGDSMNQMSEKLEMSITELKSANLELQKDIRKKEEIDEMRKEFISHVSHELKTPIALIQGYAEGLMENINEDAESRDFYCEVIRDEAARMNEMVKKLLSLNQIESGGETLDIVRFDICQLIMNKLQSSQILIDQKDIELSFEETRPVYVWADELMIEDVFGNYLSNAIHYVDQGGRIRIWFEEKDKNLRVHVYNDGRQIPEDEIPKLWIKFYKIDKARTREYGGSGIGLSIVAAAMKAHNKDYGVANTPTGVDFYFDLDMAAT